MSKEDDDDGVSTPMLPHDRYNILLEFAHVHLNFHRPEVYSVLSMYGIAIGKDCIEIPLPSLLNNTDDDDGGDTTRTTTINGENKNHYRPFIILSFSYEYLKTEFNWNIESDPSIDNDEKVTGNSNTPSFSPPENNITFPKENLISILSRCTLIRSAIELWGIGTSIHPTCTQSIHSRLSTNLLQHRIHNNATWKITVHTLGTKYTRDEQNEMRSPFSFLNFPGDVSMVNPDHEFILIREIELNNKGSPRYPRHGLNKALIPENDARPPLGVYFGKLLGGVRDWRAGGRLERYNLKKRSYLGPTSMDAELSLIMSNLGMVQKGSFVYDPFVGTGSILFTCGLRGGYCFGSDIDIRILRGRVGNIPLTNATPTPFTNFRDFDLPRPELVRCDTSIYTRHYRDHRPLYDAIVCDPPYGIRAGARKSGSKFTEPRPIQEEHRHDHIAQTRPYAVSDVMGDLLDVASRTLVLGGRLVYIIPSMLDFDTETDLPRHECLKLTHVCFQPLQMELGRRVVTMTKIREYDSTRREVYRAEVWVNGSESAEKCANIRDRILEVAKSKPGYEEKKAFRMKRRREEKEAKKRDVTEGTKKKVDGEEVMDTEEKR